ncbi:hypothetical protein [Okeania sp.]|uniref:hypothetical protein n=1 Tax=Okeania sp. TaxID=3100323 RepID=UPI002B4B2960|nr:hypothetical protein [Okeania sp.]MEB3341710.1 hypothetical protein [Okeania sp.]
MSLKNTNSAITPEAIEQIRNVVREEIKSGLQLATIRGESSHLTDSEFFVVVEKNVQKILTEVGKIISGNKVYEATLDDVWNLILKINEREDIRKYYKKAGEDSRKTKEIIDLHLLGKQHKLPLFSDYLERLREELEDIFFEIKCSPINTFNCDTDTKEIIQNFLESIPLYRNEEEQKDESDI